MNKSLKIGLTFLFIFFGTHAIYAQLVQRIYSNTIGTPQLYHVNGQQELPVYTLNSSDKLALEFDDLEGGVKNYYYTYQLCDYDWKPVNVGPFEYIKGFTQNRIFTYRNSNIALTRYTHYQVFLPEQSSMPSRSGNYLLKVYLDGDTSKTVFTKQMLVVDVKSAVAGLSMQPFTPQLFSTHQRMKFSVVLSGLNTFSAAQQIKAVVLQNNRWDNARKDIPPTFIRGNNLEYNSENIAVFAAGKEWRWLDLRSFLLQSDRVDSAHYHKYATDIYLKKDIDRRGQRYVYFPDYNGMYNISTYERLNPLWQADYATVHFRFVTPDGKPYTDKELYLQGGFTNFDLSDQWKMKWNEQMGFYETSAFLKQGYYNYTYTTVDKAEPYLKEELEGNYYETENVYTILIYYRSFTDRADQLIGVGKINTRNDKPGFSF